MEKHDSIQLYKNAFINNSSTIITYDFYNNNPYQITQIIEYLNILLSTNDVINKTIKINNINYISYLSFKQNFIVYTVFVNIETGKHAFHVSKNYIDKDFIPNMGIYDSYDTMIKEVANIYYQNWILNKKFSNIQIRYDL